MVTRVLVTAVALLGLTATPATAAVLTDPDGGRIGGSWQRWVDAQPLWLPDRIEFVHGPCPDAPGPGVAGCADERAVWVSVSPRYRGFARYVLYHELGHVVDLSMTGAARDDATAALGWRHWHPERFANHWANCADPAEAQPSLIRRLRSLCTLLRLPAG